MALQGGDGPVDSVYGVDEHLLCGGEVALRVLDAMLVSPDQRDEALAPPCLLSCHDRTPCVSWSLLCESGLRSRSYSSSQDASVSHLGAWDRREPFQLLLGPLSMQYGSLCLRIVCFRWRLPEMQDLRRAEACVGTVRGLTVGAGQ